MNLVIDDAIEVKLATKTEEEKRRELGMHYLVSTIHELAERNRRTDSS